jgi:CheY-like chemotaxis protein
MEHRPDLVIIDFNLPSMDGLEVCRIIQVKALGMSRQKIFALFSVEAALLGFRGSVLGIGSTAVIGQIVNAIVTEGFSKMFRA